MWSCWPSTGSACFMGRTGNGKAGLCEHVSAQAGERVGRMGERPKPPEGPLLIRSTFLSLPQRLTGRKKVCAFAVCLLSTGLFYSFLSSSSSIYSGWSHAWEMRVGGNSEPWAGASGPPGRLPEPSGASSCLPSFPWRLQRVTTESNVCLTTLFSSSCACSFWWGARGGKVMQGELFKNLAGEGCPLTRPDHWQSRKIPAWSHPYLFQLFTRCVLVSKAMDPVFSVIRRITRVPSHSQGVQRETLPYAQLHVQHVYVYYLILFI